MLLDGPTRTGAEVNYGVARPSRAPWLPVVASVMTQLLKLSMTDKFDGE